MEEVLINANCGLSRLFPWYLQSKLSRPSAGFVLQRERIRYWSLRAYVTGTNGGGTVRRTFVDDETVTLSSSGSPYADFFRRVLICLWHKTSPLGRIATATNSLIKCGGKQALKRAV